MCYPKKDLGIKMTNAMKETLANENDRKTASPTESAVRGSWRREHSGADDLKRCFAWEHIIRIVRERALCVREDKAFWSCQCGWYRGYISDYPSRNTFCIPGFYYAHGTHVKKHI